MVGVVVVVMVVADVVVVVEVAVGVVPVVVGELAWRCWRYVDVTSWKSILGLGVRGWGRRSSLCSLYSIIMGVAESNRAFTCMIAAE